MALPQFSIQLVYLYIKLPCSTKNRRLAHRLLALSGSDKAYLLHTQFHLCIFIAMFWSETFFNTMPSYFSDGFQCVLLWESLRCVVSGEVVTNLCSVGKGLWLPSAPMIWTPFQAPSPTQPNHLVTSASNLSTRQRSTPHRNS